MMGDNLACVANLKAEIHTLQDENLTLYEKIKRMEKNWDGLIKQTSQMEAKRIKLEREVSQARDELQTKNFILQKLGTQNADLQATITAAKGENRELSEQLQQKLKDLHEFQSNSTSATEKYNQGMKVWKEEKRTLIKQKEEITKKLDACEDELQAYFNENAKLEKQLKQLTKDFASITHAHTQIQDMLDSRETHWQKFVRRLGPKQDAIQDIYKAALTTSFCVVESGGLSPAGVLMANYVSYWNVLKGQNAKQMVAVINCLRDFLIENYLDQDSVLYLLSCTSLVLYALYTTHGKDLDDQILVRLDDYSLLECAGLQKTDESYCGSGYSSDSSDYNTEGTADYTTDSASSEYATDSNESSPETRTPRVVPPVSSPRRSATRGKPIVNLRAPVGMLNMVKPLLFSRHPRRDAKSGAKPPLMSDSDASSTDVNTSETLSYTTPRRVELHGTRDSGCYSSHGIESGYTSLTDSGFVTPRRTNVSNPFPARGRSRRNEGAWEFTIRNDEEFFSELSYMFSMTVTALLKRIYRKIDESLEFSHIEESFAHFCAFRANDPIGQPPARLVLGELTDVLNALIAAFEVHMVYFPLSQKIFEEIFGRLSRTLANVVIARSSIRSEMFGNFLLVIWERLETLCKGNEWTGGANRQLSLIKQCATLLSLKDKSLVESSRKREATFPDLNENQIRHIMTSDHRQHLSPSPSPRTRTPSLTAKLLLFSDLDYVHPFSVRITHYLGMDELQKLPVPPFLVETLGVV
eukprot:Phypoly_transcript_02873.p1 GENE.Phypoly_transcript_02873~~Phypoly_transcript_02873.p1  ORF type:complete len:753 (+),score=120.98 Phypoly_transcript_02873:184-2442(+)